MHLDNVSKTSTILSVYVLKQETGLFYVDESASFIYELYRLNFQLPLHLPITIDKLQLEKLEQKIALI